MSNSEDPLVQDSPVVSSRSNQDLIAEECAAGIAHMSVKESRALSTVGEADEIDSSNGSTEQHVSTVLDVEPCQKSRTPNVIDVERENSGWVRRHRHGAMPDERAASADRISALEIAFRGFAERKGDAVVVPSMGLTFDSLGEAYDYYNLYSWECGFGIRYGKSRTNVKGAKSMQELLCNCGGKPKKVNSTSSRTECPAMIRLLRTEDDGWYICEYRVSHNHQMLHTCAQKLHFPSHRHIDKYTRELVSQLRQNNVNLSKVYSIIGTFFGRIENVPFTKRCLRTLCAKLSRDQADEDVKKTMDYFAELKQSDPEFTYTVRVDSESRVRTLIWTTGKSKLQYHYFGDVVTFDTTYRTNLYDMPFGLFVGVNNHFQSVIYAGVLMRDEKVESFNWVFAEFVKLMGGKKPITILTDQARAMELAIEQVYPDATHRWCKWHVLKKAKESLGTLYNKRSDFRVEFHKLIQDMLTEEEFEKQWKELIDKHSLQKNTFLIQTYEKRQMWAKPYFAGKFCARMTSTQRSESANHMLKNYVPPGCPMNLFVKQYSKLQFDRDQEEGFQEKRTRLGGVVLKANIPLEKHASKIYTRTMFEIFGSYMYAAGSYTIAEIIPKRLYNATHVNAEKRSKYCKTVFVVEISEDGEIYKCQCGLFDHMGMVCCHIIKVMMVLDVKMIPQYHIMKRWTIDARDILPDHLKHYQKDMGPIESPTYRHSALYNAALELVRLGDTNVQSYEFTINYIKEGLLKVTPLSEKGDGMSVLDKASTIARSNATSHIRENHSMNMPADAQELSEVRIRNMAKRTRSESSCMNVGDGYEVDSSESMNDVFSPDRSRHELSAPPPKRFKGRPTTARDKAPYEKNVKRSRFCKICRGEGHKCTTCPLRGDAPVKPRKQSTCRNCGVAGHRRNSCGKKAVFNDKIDIQ